MAMRASNTRTSIPTPIRTNMCTSTVTRMSTRERSKFTITSTQEITDSTLMLMRATNRTLINIVTDRAGAFTMRRGWPLRQ
jgi:hypothetical protein